MSLSKVIEIARGELGEHENPPGSNRVKYWQDYDPAYQGQHIGDELMKRVMAFFENHLYVKIMPSDPKTIAFYERYGFQQYDNYSAMVLKHFK